MIGIQLRRFLVFGIAKAFESLSDILHGVLQRRERMDNIAISLVLKGVLSFVAMAVATYLFMSVFWGVVALAVAWFAVFAFYDCKVTTAVTVGETDGLFVGRIMTLRSESPRVRELLVKSLPLGVSYLLLILAPHIPRYLLEESAGQSALGIYVALMHLTARWVSDHCCHGGKQ